MPFDHGLVEVGGPGGVERGERAVVDDQQVDPQQLAELYIDAVVEAGDAEPFEQVVGSFEVHADPSPDRDMSQRGGQEHVTGNAEVDETTPQRRRLVAPRAST